jgi:hypothetical protein
MWIEMNGCESTPPVDACPRLSLDVGPAPVNGIRPPCGEDSENLSPFLSMKWVGIISNPYIGESVFPRPYMGVLFLAELIILGDFST